MLTFDYTRALDKATLSGYEQAVSSARSTVLEGTGAGNDFLGWVRLPEDIKSELGDIIACAEQLRKSCDVIVCIGIGGSYLGAKAVTELLSDPFVVAKPRIVYAGNQLEARYLVQLQDYLKDKQFGIICISKSGTTTEPAIAFRLLKAQLEQQNGKSVAKDRIVCITDATKGALRTLATQEGYKTFVIADNIGGRFSVLSPVGLLPIACAVGDKVRDLVSGACAMLANTSKPFGENITMQYAACRFHLYTKEQKAIEILCNFNPSLHFVGEWWKQLYGESEGKDHKGLYPSSADFTTDLHSMGQYIQQGVRHLFETFVSVGTDDHVICVPGDAQNLDGLNYLTGKTLYDIDQQAELGTIMAHCDGGVPCLKVTMQHIDLYNVGELFYFFEFACAMSGYLIGVNPFNQPGVEAYKKNMFTLLHKPGY